MVICCCGMGCNCTCIIPVTVGAGICGLKAVVKMCCCDWIVRISPPWFWGVIIVCCCGVVNWNPWILPFWEICWNWCCCGCHCCAFTRKCWPFWVETWICWCGDWIWWMETGWLYICCVCAAWDVAISVLPTIVIGGGTAIIGGGTWVTVLMVGADEYCGGRTCMCCDWSDIDTVGGGCCICWDNCCEFGDPLSSPSAPRSSVLIGLSLRSGVDFSSFTASSLQIGFIVESTMFGGGWNWICCNNWPGWGGAVWNIMFGCCVCDCATGGGWCWIIFGGGTMYVVPCTMYCCDCGGRNVCVAANWLRCVAGCVVVCTMPCGW